MDIEYPVTQGRWPGLRCQSGSEVTVLTQDDRGEHFWLNGTSLRGQAAELVQLALNDQRATLKRYLRAEWKIQGRPVPQDRSMAGRYGTGVYIRDPLVPSHHSATKFKYVCKIIWRRDFLSNMHKRIIIIHMQKCKRKTGTRKLSHYFSKCNSALHYFSKCNSAPHYFSKCNSAPHYFSKCNSAPHYFSKCTC